MNKITKRVYGFFNIEREISEIIRALNIYPYPSDIKIQVLKISDADEYVLIVEVSK